MTDKLDRTPFTAESIKKKGGTFLGLDKATLIKGLFGGNALVAIVVLALITFFLFREGVEFFPQYRKDMALYRKSGQELVGILQEELNQYTLLQKQLEEIQVTLATKVLEEVESKDWQDEGAKWAAYGAMTQPFLDYTMKVREAAGPLKKIEEKLRDSTKAMKEAVVVQDTRKEILGADLSKLMWKEEAEAYLAESRGDVMALMPEIVTAHKAFRTNVQTVLGEMPDVKAAGTEGDIALFQEAAEKFLDTIPNVEKTLTNYDSEKPFTFWQSLGGFFMGADWITNSSWQDYYGIWPLLSGSLMVTAIALSFAIPLGIFAAIYVNQIARPSEQNLIKPFIEFISALPSVVIGFFGIAVFGHFLRIWSQAGLDAPEVPVVLQGISFVLLAVYAFFAFRWVLNPALKPSSNQLIGQVVVVVAWAVLTLLAGPVLEYICAFLNGIAERTPFFPISERLNAFTAGGLLALMAVPTIFTLAEDALNNVPKAFTEASEAMGATRWQTVWRIQIPTALSGIISAVLLGFGRVIGETMVVLLCAGNRIKVPDFSDGVGTVYQPVHTMTGIIAQEMGEVVPESIHYRALFCVGIFLFFLSLLINYVAQVIVRKYKISAG